MGENEIKSRIENRIGSKIGIHDISFGPPLQSIDKISKDVHCLDAESWAHLPEWRDVFLNKESYAQMTIKPDYIDDSWWVDRGIELVTPLPRSPVLMAKNILTSLAYPIPPLSKAVTAGELLNFPESGFIRRWPFFPSEGINSSDVEKIIKTRNLVLKLMSPKVESRREVLDIHSVGIGLNTKEILDWQKQGRGRRLMFSGLMIDERLAKYGFDIEGHKKLIEPLIPYASVVTLKIGSLLDETGKVVRNESDVVNEILRRETNGLYAEKLKELQEVVGTKLDISHVDYLIKIKKSKAIDGVTNEQFIGKYLEFLNNVLR